MGVTLPDNRHGRSLDIYGFTAWYTRRGALKVLSDLAPGGPIGRPG